MHEQRFRLDLDLQHRDILLEALRAYWDSLHRHRMELVRDVPDDHAEAKKILLDCANNRLLAADRLLSMIRESERA